ncbi:MAG: hypothetical protein WD801_10080 [Gemmatimonadaceae bacterium]
MPGSMMGDFLPTPLGEQLMSVLAGAGPAAVTLGRLRQSVLPEPHPDSDAAGGREHNDALQQTTEFADYASNQVYLESLELELRGPDGSVIPTESIGLQDTEYLLALASEADPNDTWESDLEPPLDPELEAAIDHDERLINEWFSQATVPEWEEDDAGPPAFPRYQIMVRRVN